MLRLDAQKTTQILRRSATPRNLCRRDRIVCEYFWGWILGARVEAHMEKIVLLCLLIGTIGVLAEFARTAQPRQ
jgi:hypothetical protein